MGLIITTTQTRVLIDISAFASLQEIGGTKYMSFPKGIIKLYEKEDRISVEIEGEKPWSISVALTEGCLPVTSVNGVAPSDIPDLLTKLHVALS